MKYVDVLLPLPFNEAFTYDLKPEQAKLLKVGYRVIVPFGLSKTYTGIVLKLHNNKPQFETKTIIDVPDNYPLVLEKQLKLWQWISSYYMAPLGDVYKAALPSALKIEDGYRPKTEYCVKLGTLCQNYEGIALALSMLRGSKKQQQAFLSFLSLAFPMGWENTNNYQVSTYITKEELLNVSKVSASIITELTKKSILQIYEREIERFLLPDEPLAISVQPLSSTQERAYNQIITAFNTKDVVLLHGVTGSGKTEIYIHLIHFALQKGQQVLYMLPEIALTVQIMQRLKRVFGSKLGIYHSKITDAERAEMWNKQLSNNPFQVILGVRSSVFLPFQHLGLVVIDEEHESSFKQIDPSPRYHARSVGIMLANMYGAKTVLGTATPSIESYYNALNNKYALISLNARFKDIALPKIEVVDVKDLKRRKLMKGIFSQTLIDAVQEALETNKQVILFQNRRGFAPITECKECGWVPKCKNCDVSLTLHKNLNYLSCHYCGYTYQIPQKCPQCGCDGLYNKGFGTEKIEEVVQQLFPLARIARMDLDTTRTKNAYERLINDFSLGKTNVLIGTQMVSKGLDFDNVKVVGIIDADSMLNYPDFRSYEYSFAMLAQVAGRAGRKGEQGRVILQTKNTELPIISQIASNDYSTFYKETELERKAFYYPPFYRLICVYLKYKKEEVVNEAAIVMGNQLRTWFGNRLLGPDKPSIARVKAQHIRKLVLKLEKGLNANDVRHYLVLAEKNVLANKKYAAIAIYYDVDPV